MQAQDYELTFQRRRAPTAPTSATSAVLEVRSDGERVGTLEPERRRTRPRAQTPNEPSIRTDSRTGEDLFLILEASRPTATPR